MNEFDLITKLTSGIQYKDKNIIKGVGDDAAVIKFNNKEYLLFTTDSLVENVHFKTSWQIKKEKIYYFIGWKALTVNISDILAMGGTPPYSLVSLYLPKKFNTSYIEQIYNGLNDASVKYKVELIGGNISRSSKLIIGITLIGKVKKNNLLLRSTAKAGDYIYTEKNVGYSAEGLKALLKGQVKLTPKILSHLKPEPGINWNKLFKYKITGAIDISDGFLADLNHILKQSKKGAEIFIDKIKNSDYFLYGGEDYKIIFTSPDNIKEENIIKIGRITENEEIFLITKNSRIKIQNIKGFSHL